MRRPGARSAAYQPQVPPSADPRSCAAPGCTEPGQYRAPRSRQALNDYLWFCLPHVREYNAAWDFYKGMNANEIEGHLRQDTAWQRPTWPLGRLGGHSRFDPEALRDPLGALHGTPLHEARRRRREEEAARASGIPAKPPAELRAALDVLGLDWPLDQPRLKARYKELAKRLHPDANGGNREAEEQLKDVNRAYSLLRVRLGRGGEAARSPAPEPAAP